jgi:excisionase family DNA binding protein
VVNEGQLKRPSEGGNNKMKRRVTFDDLPITLRANEVAEVLGVSLSNAYVIMHSKGFPKMQIGKRILVTKDNLQAWIAAQSASNIGTFTPKK